MDKNTQTTSALELPTEVLIDIAVKTMRGVIAVMVHSQQTGSRTGEVQMMIYCKSLELMTLLIGVILINLLRKINLIIFGIRLIHTLQKKMYVSHVHVGSRNNIIAS